MQEQLVSKELKILLTYSHFPFQNKRSENDYLGETPTLSLVQKWLREKHNIVVEAPCIRFSSKRKFAFQYAITFNDYNSYEQMGDFETYEEALEEGLLESLKLIQH